MHDIRDPRDFGSTPTHDTIQAAIDDAATKGGGIVLIPPGVWDGDGITLRSNVRVMGHGPGSTILTGGGESVVSTGVSGWDAGGRRYHCGLEMVGIRWVERSGGPKRGTGLHLGSATYSWASDVTINGASVGVRVDGISYISHLTRVRATGGESGFKIHNGPRDIVLDQCSTSMHKCAVLIDQDGARGVGGITVERGSFSSADTFVDVRASTPGGTNTIRIVRNRFEGAYPGGNPVNVGISRGPHVVDLDPITHEGDTNHYQQVGTRRQVTN